MDHQLIGTCFSLFKKIEKKRDKKRSNGAFKSGAGKNSWDVKSIFKAAHTILHDTSAQRVDFISVTGEERFPLFFCATRWVEDTVVADRLTEIFESITKILRYWERFPKSKQPSSKSFLSSRSCQ